MLVDWDRTRRFLGVEGIQSVVENIHMLYDTLRNASLLASIFVHPDAHNFWL